MYCYHQANKRRWTNSYPALASWEDAHELILSILFFRWFHDIFEITMSNTWIAGDHIASLFVGSKSLVSRKGCVTVGFFVRDP